MLASVTVLNVSKMAMKRVFTSVITLALASIITVAGAHAQEEASAQAEYLSDLENAVVAEINLARSDPKAYSVFLEELLPYYDDKKFKRPGDEMTRLTREGAAAVEEALAFLQSAEPQSPLMPSRGMSQATKNHLNDKDKNGSTGSDDSQPWDRVNRHGTWGGTIAESISFGRNDAQDVVIHLIIDDGFADRGNRNNIFEKEFQVTGVACGDDEKYTFVCVIDYAGTYTEGSTN